jgi:Domain of unknown function (DUF4397)
MHHLRTRLAAVFAVALTLVALPAFTSSAGASSTVPAPGTSKVWVTHGLPLDDAGTVVDVYVDGALAIEDFAFGQTVGPLTLPAATYDIEVTLANTDTTAIDQDVTVPAGGNFSVVASYTSADGAIGLNVFANDLGRIPRLTGRLALHHAAAAPAVDVDLGLFPLSRWLPWLKVTKVSGAVNGDQDVILAPSFLAYTADVRVSGTQTTVLSLDDVRLQSRRLTNLYVVGSAAAGTLQTVRSVIEP